MNCVREAVRIIEDYDVLNDQSSYQAQTLPERAIGRPRFDIPFNQLSSLLERRFTVPQISDILGVSIRTVRRRMSVYKLSVRSYYLQVSDGDLDAIVAEILMRFPACGNRQMQGHLLARGMRVQQHRVRESQRRVDPSGVMM